MAERLDDTGIGQRLARIDALLEQVEAVPGPTARAAIDAVAALAEVYGEALARVVDLADPALTDRIVADELLGHLLVLHDLHPETVEQRVSRALDEVRAHGGDVELAGIADGVARVRVAARGCGAGEVRRAVDEAVRGLAPELASVEPEAVGAQTLIPVDALLHRP